MNMRIDSDVRGVSQFFGLDPRVLQAIVRAEGDILGVVRRRYPHAIIETREEALKLVARCGVHAMWDWIRIGGPGDDDRLGAIVGHWAKWWTYPGGAARWRNAVLRELAEAK
jgi:hypothetical protein